MQRDDKLREAGAVVVEIPTDISESPYSGDEKRVSAAGERDSCWAKDLLVKESVIKSKWHWCNTETI